MRTLFLLLLILNVLPQPVRAGDAAAPKPAQLFDQANKLYEKGEYAKAVEAYRALLRQESISAAVYFNLGNAFFKTGDVASALVAFKKAERLSPRDSQIRANIAHVVSVSKAPVYPAPSILVRLLRRLTLNEWTTMAMIFGWVWLLFLILRQWQPTLKPKLKGYTATAGILFLMVNLCVVTLVISSPLGNTAFARSGQAALRRGPLPESDIVQSLVPGAELRLTDIKGDWFQMRNASGQVGWIHQKEVLFLSVSPKEL